MGCKPGPYIDAHFLRIPPLPTPLFLSIAALLAFSFAAASSPALAHLSLRPSVAQIQVDLNEGKPPLIGLPSAPTGTGIGGKPNAFRTEESRKRWVCRVV